MGGVLSLTSTSFGLDAGSVFVPVPQNFFKYTKAMTSTRIASYLRAEILGPEQTPFYGTAVP